MMEIKGYNHPPEILSNVIVATLLLLREPENELEVRGYFPVPSIISRNVAKI